MKNRSKDNFMYFRAIHQRAPLCNKNVRQVIFSQSSELLERESSMASSLEEVSGTPGNEPSGGAPPTDHFGVFKDFDFLEYESESIEVSVTNSVR